MSAFLALIVYILVTGQPVMEHKVFQTGEACEAFVQERATKLDLNDKVMGIVVAGCGQVPAESASAK